MKEGDSVSATLRKTIETSSETRYRIAIETGVSEAALSRFVSGKRGLSLDALDKLAAHLGLALLPIIGKNAAKVRKEKP